MTSPFLIPDLKLDEGLRLTAYPDPLTHAAPWTIGYGHTGPEVHQGLVWTPAQADAALAHDVERVLSDLAAALFPWWPTLAPLRQDVLANMAFNMGVGGLLAFHHMLNACSTSHWLIAHDAMLDSKWARQLPHRAGRLAVQMLTGTHA